MQVAAACLTEGKEARHEALVVDDLHLHSSGGAGRIPPRHRSRLAVGLLEARALCGVHLLLRRLGALSRLRLLLKTRAQPGHLVGVALFCPFLPSSGVRTFPNRGCRTHRGCRELGVRLAGNGRPGGSGRCRRLGELSGGIRGLSGGSGC